ncbi:MAG TPA: enoyl-CoA hydratase/isomerase family protein [Acetobacteraceae bacterium]|nr:enoyl-CoA hydratase/isomerase family protein [Acetobacteraceae bacterium]
MNKQPCGREQSVAASRDGRVGRIWLNRPAALNALDLGMVRALHAALDLWREEPRVHAVVVESTDPRAFCAGGDVRAVREFVRAGDDEAVFAFFSEEYALNRAIAEYPKPYIALVDGICMGGGIGISVHGAACVASEHAVFAMPETAIALFPDIGASHVLPRLPGALGIWLALTGARLAGADAVHAGLATHYVPRARLADLSQALAEDGPGVLASFAAPLPAFSFRAQRAAIDRCFGAPSVAEILARLAAEETEFGHATLAALRGFSPSSICWSFEILRRGAEHTLPAALAEELRLVQRVTRHPDFAEGVRAMLVDKDRKPRWTPATIEEVDPAAIAAMFVDGQTG